MRSTRLSLSLLLLATAVVNGAPPPATPQDLQNLTIEARRHAEQQRARAFVDHVVVPLLDRSYPVWREPVCIGLFGVSSAQGQFIRTRLTQIFTQAGAPLAGAGCQANLHIVVTAHADALVEAWTTRNDGVPAGAGWHAEKHRLEQPRPIRVWYGVGLVAADGTSSGGTCPGQTQASEVRVVCNAFATRLQFNELTRFDSLVIIVDLARVSDFSLGQLVDYIGLVGLTRINLDAHLQGEPTILGLFGSPHEERLQGLSAWDQAFLAALYHSNLATRGQDADIARAMVAALDH
jgi:hypothetical protein